MRKILNLDIKRGIVNINWLTSVILLVIVLYRPLRGCFDNIGLMHVLEWVTLPMALSGFSVFAAVFPVLGYSNSFYNDYNTGYIRFILTRMSWKKYGIMRIISVGVSGGLTLGIPFTIIFIICYIVGDKGSLAGRLYAGTHIELFVEQYGIVITLIVKVLLGFLVGALWALVGYCVSLFVLNKYMALVCPFVIYQFMWIILFKFPLFNPIFLMRGDDLDSYLVSGVMLIIYISLVCIMIMNKLNRRIQDV